ncbi:MAG: GNAT family N-acetyltransferase [Tissierellia bacterium]|nr:GNAT family N-acetyltransferase [Tissierellia bacterium]
MKTYKLKNNRDVVIREALKSDAKDVIDFYNVVGGETDFLSFGKNEFNVTVEFEENYLFNISNEENSILILALIDDLIIGAASINSPQKRRLKHVGTLGIVIRQEYCKLGLGKILINELINWAKSNNITKKISLITRCDNEFAIELYKNLGFEIEGVLKKENYEKGKYYDTITMGLLLD